MAIGNMHKKCRKDRECGSGDILADRQTDRQTDRQRDVYLLTLFALMSIKVDDKKYRVLPVRMCRQ